MIDFTEMPLDLGNFDLMDFTGINFIKQANAAFLYPIYYFLIIVVHYLATKISKTCYKRKICRFSGINIYKEPVWEGFSRMIFYCYLELIICCFITIKEMNYDELMKSNNKLDIFSYISAYVTLYFLYMFPIIIIGIILKQNWNEETLESSQFKEKYNYLILDVQITSILKASFHAFYMIRRIIVSYALVYMNE